MKSAITIALVAGTASATSLRSDRSFDISTVHSTSFIEALASKYNCREAGATLEETLTKSKPKMLVSKVLFLPNVLNVELITLVLGKPHNLHLIPRHQKLYQKKPLPSIPKFRMLTLLLPLSEML